MKNLMNFRAVAIAISFTVLAGTTVFAAEQSNALNEDMLSTSEFKALSGISADPMNEAELDKVQGKLVVYKRKSAAEWGYEAKLLLQKLKYAIPVSVEYIVDIRDLVVVHIGPDCWAGCGGGGY